MNQSMYQGTTFIDIINQCFIFRIINFFSGSLFRFAKILLNYCFKKICYESSDIDKQLPTSHLTKL